MRELRSADMAGLFEACHREVIREKRRLTDLDGRFGDGDLGVNLDMGFAAVCLKAQEKILPVAQALRQAGMTLNAAAPSTLGTLLAFAMIAAADAAESSERYDAHFFAQAMRAGMQSVQRMGRCEAGDRTLLDAWIPCLEAAERAAREGLALPEAAKQALDAAEAGAEHTKSMPGKLGRAGMFAEQTIGYPDGGAMAFATLMRGFYKFVSA